MFKNKYIFIYSEEFEFIDYGKLSNEKGNLMIKILKINSSINEIKIQKKQFQILKERVVVKLKELIIFNKNFPMKYPSNIEMFDSSMFIKKKIFGEQMKLFQGGQEILIIAMSNLLDLLNSAIKKNQDFIRVLFFENLMKHQEFLISPDGPSMS